MTLHIEKPRMLQEKDIRKLEDEFCLLKPRCIDITDKILKLSETLKKDKAKEYFVHGVGRRLSTIYRCAENIYSLFPLRQKTLLPLETLKDIAINLHAFFINIFGLLDNMAWVVVYEKDEEPKIKKTWVGLYKPETQEILPTKFKEYLRTMKEWHDTYLKNYRDALSHRIPLYVPPKQVSPKHHKQEAELQKKINAAYGIQDFSTLTTLNKQHALIGDPAPFFIHSLSETDKPVLLHAQISIDLKTVEEIVEKFCQIFPLDTPE